MKILKDINLKNLSTFKVDANAKYFVEINRKEDILELLKTDIFKKEQRYILGRGANTLFSKDFNGLVIKMSIKGVDVISEDSKSVLIKIGGGEDWPELVKKSVDNNWTGLESLADIPGTVGAAPIQNIGAYGRELSDVFEYLEAIDLSSGQEIVLDKSECQFGYRESIFKGNGKDRYIIMNIVLKLNKISESLDISDIPQYKSLIERLDSSENSKYTLQDIYNTVVKIRGEKLPSIEEYGSNGCLFTNPIISFDQLNSLQKKFPGVPYWETENENFLKISAGWLLEELGWKGKREGDVGVWDKHSLIVVNYGNASGEEIKKFAEKIANDFLDKTDIKLQLESNII